MSDVGVYLENIKREPVRYFIPAGIFSSKGPQEYVPKTDLTDDEYRRLYGIVKRALSKVPDALTVDEAVTVSGYSRTFVVDIIQDGRLYAELISRRYIIPKEKLICFLAGRYGLAVTYKSEWHERLYKLMR
jgi:hypothetical protein